MRLNRDPRLKVEEETPGSSTKKAKKAKKAEETTSTSTENQPKTKEKVKKAFNPLELLDETLDDIEKSYALTGNSMLLGEKRQTTGLLSLDLVLGGGITAGWYTTFGVEQSCKSTLAMTILCACVESNIPAQAYFDYEGCLISDALVETPNGLVTIGSLFSEYPVVDEFTKVNDVKVKTVGNTYAEVEGITFKGIKPITKITTNVGTSLAGYKHPVLTLTEDGDLDWKFLEDLTEDDYVVTE